MGSSLSVIDSALSIQDTDRPPSDSPPPPSNLPSVSPLLRRSTRSCAGDQETSQAKYHHSTIPGDDSVDFTTLRMDKDDLAQDQASSLLKAAAGVLHGIRAQDNEAAALQRLVASQAAGAARTGEFFY